MTAVETVVLATPTVPVRLIEPSPHNPRHAAVPDAELIASIRQHGILQPLVVRPAGEDDDGYILIAGHRRLAAAIEAGLDRVPVNIRAATDTATALELTLIENLHRQDLSPLEQARGFKTLADMGRTQAQIAEMVAVSQPLVSKRMGLLKLPEVAQKAAEKGRDSGGISLEEAAALAALPKADVEAVFKRSATPAPWMIQEAVKDHLDSKARAKVLADLKTGGVKVVDRLGYWDGDKPPVQVAALSWVDKKAHLTAKCRVVKVDRDGRIVEGCSKPANHPKRGKTAAPAQETAADKAEREAELRRWSLKSSARDRREQFCKELLAGRHTNVSDIAALAAYLFTCNDGYETDVAAALKLLDVEADWQAQAVTAREMIVADQAFGSRFLFALALDLGLAVTFNDGFDCDRVPDDPALEPVKFFLAWLEVRGYELDELEAALLYGTDELEAELPMCRECGCTDDHACEGGCSWVEEDLCSACSAPAPAAGDLMAALQESLATPRPTKLPRPSKLPRGICPVCGDDVALRKGGLVREHRTPVCSGSGAFARGEEPGE